MKQGNDIVRRLPLVVVMHVAIIGGGFLSMVFGSPAALLFVLVVLKTIIDVELHLREHKAKGAHRTMFRMWGDDE